MIDFKSVENVSDLQLLLIASLGSKVMIDQLSREKPVDHWAEQTLETAIESSFNPFDNAVLEVMTDHLERACEPHSRLVQLAHDKMCAFKQMKHWREQ